MHQKTGIIDAELKKWLIIAAASTALLALLMFLLIFCTDSKPKDTVQLNIIPEKTEETVGVLNWHIQTGTFYISEDDVVCGSEVFSAPSREVFDEILLAAQKEGKIQIAEKLSEVPSGRGTVKLESYFDSDCYLTDTDTEKLINDAVISHIKDSSKGMPQITVLSIASDNEGIKRCYTLDYNSKPSVSAEVTNRDENGVYLRSASCKWALDENIDSEIANKLVKYVRDNFGSEINGEGAVLHIALKWKSFSYERDIVCNEENEETINMAAGFILTQAHSHDAEAANIGFMTKEGRVK